MFHVFEDVKTGKYQRSMVTKTVQSKAKHAKISGPMQIMGKNLYTLKLATKAYLCNRQYKAPIFCLKKS